MREYCNSSCSKVLLPFPPVAVKEGARAGSGVSGGWIHKSPPPPPPPALPTCSTGSFAFWMVGASGAWKTPLFVFLFRQFIKLFIHFSLFLLFIFAVLPASFLFTIYIFPSLLLHFSFCLSFSFLHSKKTLAYSLRFLQFHRSCAGFMSFYFQDSLCVCAMVYLLV